MIMHDFGYNDYDGYDDYDYYDDYEDDYEYCYYYCFVFLIIMSDNGDAANRMYVCLPLG
jgi:hypothetical protein